MMLAFWPTLAGQTPDVSGSVDRAIELLFSPDTTGAQCTDGLVSLLDAILEVAPAARIDGAWAVSVSAARERMAGGRMAEAAALLDEGYRAVNGKRFAMPPVVRSLDAARDHIRRQLSSVRGLMDQGRANEAVGRMLEAAMMIVTPIRA
jgi:hypothetical protein